MSNKGYVYEMYETENWQDSDPIYIGKTKNIKSRVNGHFSILNNGKMMKEEYEKVKSIRVAEFPTYADAGIVERYLIGVKQPRNNTQILNEGIPTVKVDLSGRTFYELDMKNVEIREPKRQGVRSRSKWLNYLDKCYFVYNDGSNIYLVYPRSRKRLYFMGDDEEYEKLGGPFPEPDLLIISGDVRDDFFAVVERLGIPGPNMFTDALDEEGVKSISDFRKKASYFNREYGDTNYMEMYRRVEEYINNYNGIEFDPFYYIKDWSPWDRVFSTLGEAEEVIANSDHCWRDKCEIRKVTVEETTVVKEYACNEDRTEYVSL